MEMAHSLLIVGVVHCMEQANAFNCGMFAAAFKFEWACIPVTRLLQTLMFAMTCVTWTLISCILVDYMTHA